MIRHREALKAIGLLYDAAIDITRWPIAVGALACVFEAESAQLSHFDAVGSRFAFTVAHGREAPFLEALHNSVAGCGRDSGRPILGRSFVATTPSAESCSSAAGISSGALSPSPLGHILAVVVDSGPETLSAIGAVRMQDRHPFGQDDCDLLDEFVPHIRRIARLQVRFALMEVSGGASADVLDRFPIGIAIAEEDGRLRFTNLAARDLAGDGFVLRHGYVSADFPEERAGLLLAIRRAVQAARDGRPRPAEAMAITRASGEPPLALMISTLWGKHIQFERGLLDDPHAILFVSDPRRFPRTPAETLGHLFGLTPKEAQVVECLTANLTLEATAEQLGITKGTARIHMKKIFQKTEIRSQAELISIVRSSPSWLQPAHVREEPTAKVTVARKIRQISLDPS